MARACVVLGVLAGLCPVLVGGMAQAGGGDAASARARASKGAVKLVTARGRPLPGRWQSWADVALVPTVAGRVKVRMARCPARKSAAGCVYTRRPRTVYLRPGLRDPRGVLLHELGHVYDLKVMNNRDRGRFRRLMRRRAKWWSGREPLAEQFAEAYSWCARYARIVSIARYSSYRYRPSARQHRRICALIARAAGDGARAKAPPNLPPVTRPHAPPPPPPSSAPGTVPGDPQRDPGPQAPADPDEPQDPEQPDEPTPAPLPVPVPTPSATPAPLPTPPPLPTGGSGGPL